MEIILKGEDTSLTKRLSSEIFVFIYFTTDNFYGVGTFFCDVTRNKTTRNKKGSTVGVLLNTLIHVRKSAGLHSWCRTN